MLVEAVDWCGTRPKMYTLDRFPHTSSLCGSYELPDDGVGTPKHVGAFG
jgi:hypothetical protein